MLRVIRFLFTGDWHLHKWETFETMYLVNYSGTRTGTEYHLRCKHCGDVMSRKIK